MPGLPVGCRDVIDRVDVATGPIDRVGVQQIADDDLDTRALEIRGAGPSNALRPHEPADDASSWRRRREMTRQMAARETRDTGDQDAHR